MNKRKLMLVAIALCMAAILLAGGTLAYLTDTDNAVNTFTAGKVGLTLDEAIVEKVTDSTAENYGDLVATNERTDGDQTYHVYPGNKVAKDPKITVDSDSENAWVAAKMIVTGDLLSLIGSGYENYLDITKIVSGGLVVKGAEQQPFNGLTPTYYANGCYIYQKPIAEGETTQKWELYLFMEDIYAANAEIQLFTNIEIPAEWDNAEMEKFNNSKINITAFAVQADGFESCYEAMTTAFPGEFAF